MGGTIKGAANDAEFVFDEAVAKAVMDAFRAAALTITFHNHPYVNKRIRTFDADNNAGRIDIKAYNEFLRRLATTGHIKMEELS